MNPKTYIIQEKCRKGSILYVFVHRKQCRKNNPMSEYPPTGGGVPRPDTSRMAPRMEKTHAGTTTIIELCVWGHNEPRHLAGLPLIPPSVALTSPNRRRVKDDGRGGGPTGAGPIGPQYQRGFPTALGERER